MLFSLGLGSALLLSPEIRPPHEFDLLNVKYDIALDFKSESVSGFVENKLVTTKDDANLAFDKGPMQIKSIAVKGAQNFVVKVTDTNVFVKLPNSKSGLSVSVTISYSAAPEAGIYFVNAKRAYPGTTDVAYSQGEMEDNRYWLPTYDFPDDKATAEGTIRVPKGMSVLSNGSLVSKADKGKQTIWSWKMDKAMSTYLISFVAGNYSAIYDGEFNEKPVQIWTPKGLEDWGRAAFQGTDGLISIFSKLTGVDYPWQKYAQAAVPEFIFGGMENTSCTTQTINALFPPNSRGTESGEGLNAHELAHQWFGDLVTAPNWSHIWINEGWATFMPHFSTRQRHGEDEYQIQRWGTYEGAKGAAYNNPMVRADYTIPMEMFDGNAYSGGAARMFMLMKLLGEERFWKCCKAYLQEYGHKNVTTEDFFNSWAKTSNRYLGDFRKQWFYTKGVPKIRVTHEGDDFYIENMNKDFGFEYDLEIQFLNEDGVLLKNTVQMNPGGKTGISGSKIGMGGPSVKTIIVDPGAWLMCDIEYPDYTDDQWILAYKSAENAAQKMRLIDKITRNNRSLMTIWNWERSPQVKKQLIAHLNEPALLVDLLGSKDEAIVRLAMNRLNSLKDPAVDQIANRIFSTTTNESLQNNAFQILLATRNNQATAERGWTTKTYNLATQTAALNWYATNRPATARKMALDAVANYAPGPVRMAAIGVLGRVKDEPGKRDVFNLLVSIAKGRSYSPMSAAINALVEYGDKAAIPVIESRKNHSLHFGRNLVASALERLGK